MPDAPAALVKLEFGVIVNRVSPEQATVCETPWPNSIPAPELSEILPARVLWKNKTEAKMTTEVVRNFL